MERSSKYLWILNLYSLLFTACDGEILFRTKTCEDGAVRKEGVCISETSESKVNCLDVNLDKLQKGEIVTMCDGSTGEGRLTQPSDCVKEDDQNCLVTSKFKVVDSSKLNPSKIANGTVIAGIAGSMLGAKQCRNLSSLTNFDSSYLPSNTGWTGFTFAPAAVNLASDQITTIGLAHGLATNSPVRFTSSATMPAPLVANTTYYAIYISETVIQVASVLNGTPIDITSQGTGTHRALDVADNIAQYFDTLDDYNNNQATSPANSPWSSNDFHCDATNFVNVTSNAAPLLPSGLTPTAGNQPFTQIWQDQISGIFLSNILYDGVSLDRHWSDATRACESLNGSTAGEGWRLPTQKELMQLYIHGISKVALAGGNMNDYFRSSSGDSMDLQNTWSVILSRGYVTGGFRGAANLPFFCIR